VNLLGTISILAFVQSAPLAKTVEVPGPIGFQGTWVGRCVVNGNDVFVRLRIDRQGNRISGAAYSRALGIRRAPALSVQSAGSRLSLSFRTPEGVLQVDCERHEDELSGTGTIGGSHGRCAFRRRQAMDEASFDAFQGDYALTPDHIVFVGRYETANELYLVDGDLRVAIMPVGPSEFLSDDLRTIRFERDDDGSVVAANISKPGLSPQRAPRARLYQRETVRFTSGDVHLVGWLTIPNGPEPHPALVFVHGSGPATRDFHNVEADLFARHGIASLAADKRGAGESTGDWRLVDFDVLAGDALAGVEFVRRDPRIRANQVGLWGISQAAWIIPLAAARSADVAFIVPISGGAVSPAEQELWRQRQNLRFLSVPERFIELERMAASMAYDWQRQNQLGRMPIPNFFADENLNMFHDAPAVLRRVKQPVLAIFGGMDTLTPPQESAAIWAGILRHRPDRDFSVRLFPGADHGLCDGGKTGSPLELRRELRWVPGYTDTMVRWIRQHVDRTPFADAFRVDVDAETTPEEARGMQEISWYGSGLIQPWQLFASLLVFASAVLAAPIAGIWRRLRGRRDSASVGPRRTCWLAALWGLLNVSIMVAMTYVFYHLIDAQPNPVIASLDRFWNAISAATWLSLVLMIMVGYDYIRSRRTHRWSRAARIYYGLVMLTGLLWIPFVLYWDLLLPAW
jgi:dienelactone hydrolase